ncbi:MAG: hypothetical protein JO149_04710 [Gammaproteobacteria bacterium]|nr:hypothetical protein [Gammaproteobacteria bacterium]
MNSKYSLLNIKVGLFFLMALFLTACTSNPLKAPCDQYASFCGTKTPINHWE